MSQGSPLSLKYTGASSGELIVGLDSRNLGMVLRVEDEQSKGAGRHPKGSVFLIDEGSGYYADLLSAFVGQSCDGSELYNLVLDRINARKIKEGESPMSRTTIFDVNSIGRLLTVLESVAINEEA